MVLKFYNADYELGSRSSDGTKIRFGIRIQFFDNEAKQYSNVRIDGAAPWARHLTLGVVEAEAREAAIEALQAAIETLENNTISNLERS